MENKQLETNEIEIDIREVCQLLFQKAGIILLTGLVLAMLTIGYTKCFVTPMYQSKTKMYVLTQQNNSMITSSDLTASAYLTKDYVELITSRTVLENVIKEMELPLDYEQFLKRVTVTATDNTRVVAIEVLDESAERARAVADAVRIAASEHIQEVMNIEVVNVVDKAHLPNHIHSPHVMRNGLLAGILGCCLAMGLILVLHLTNDKIITPEDVDKYLGLCVLGSIPVDKELINKKKKFDRGLRRWKR